MEYTADIPMQIHPNYIEAPHYEEFASASPIGSSVYTAAKAALSDVATLYGKIEATEMTLIKSAPADGRKVLIPNPQGYGPDMLITPEGSEHKYVGAVTKAYKGTLLRVTGKLNQMETTANHLTEQLNEVLKDTGGFTARSISIASEIRSHMRALPPERQHDLMHEMINNNYKAGFAAILEAPPFLSGMSNQDLLEYKEIAQQTWAPETVQRLDTTRRLIGIVGNARQMLDTRYSMSIARMSHEDITGLSRQLAELRGLA